MFGVHDVHAYAPMLPTRSAELVDALSPGSFVNGSVLGGVEKAVRLERPLLDMLGVNAVITDRPDVLVASYPLPLIEVRGPDRYRLLTELRQAPNTHSVFPFGESLHYTDTREGIDPRVAADDLTSFAESRGLVLTLVEPGTPGIEDTFMLLMGSDEDAAW